MSVNDQPSILTVCLASGTAKPSRSEISELLANRTASLFAAPAQASTSEKPSSVGFGTAPEIERCPACDDSACGMEASGMLCNDGTENRTASDANNRTAGRVEGTELGGTASFFHADSGKAALALLRVLRFDLLVTSDRLPDMTTSQLVRRVRAAWPWQKWALVGSQITTQDEVTARTLGAMAVLDAPADWQLLAELAEGVRSRAANTAAEGLANVRAAAGKCGVRDLGNETDRSTRRNRKFHPSRQEISRQEISLQETASVLSNTASGLARGVERSVG